MSLMDKINLLLEFTLTQDPSIYHHQERTALYSVALAKELNLSAKETETVYFAGLLHDLGKVVLKDLPLEQHPWLGFCLLFSHPELSEVAHVVLHHHECFNGSGYPNHYKQEMIPFLARVLRVADRYDHLRMGGLTHTQAVFELRELSGKELDPELLDAFVSGLEHEELLELV